MRNSAQTTMRGSAQQPTMRSSGKQPPAVAAAAAAAAAAPAPWGQESLRFSSSAAAQARPASEATMRATSAAAAQPRGMLMALHEEFDLNNPPNEENQTFSLPSLDPKSPTISLTISCVDGRVEQVCNLWIAFVWEVDQHNDR